MTCLRVHSAPPLLNETWAYARKPHLPSLRCVQPCRRSSTCCRRWGGTRFWRAGWHVQHLRRPLTTRCGCCHLASLLSTVGLHVLIIAAAFVLPPAHQLPANSTHPTHAVQWQHGGGLATGIRRELPWLKLVASMREPISAEISGLVHRMGTCAIMPSTTPWACTNIHGWCRFCWHGGFHANLCFTSAARCALSPLLTTHAPCCRCDWADVAILSSVAQLVGASPGGRVPEKPAPPDQ